MYRRDNIVYGVFTYLLSKMLDRCGPDAKYFSPLTPPPESAE